ncbi:MAG: heparan-alpha-glucosaminide N-acetyltransferase domain-containing protein [Melioribacteraceae bacterium]|nr:heparan-alpha-glucosaminide N-acetyltransferase domain-containing protein [Melioribacteraceae bacterium]
MKNTQNKRIESIDLLRGLVMVIMALDHVRDFFHYDAFFFDPSDLTQTNFALFFTRFVTHFCAPVFVFLAGTSAFFVGQRRDKKSLSSWLLKRGVWLIFTELTVVKFGWLFKLDYSTTLLMVIWVLGVSMIFLAGFIHLPKMFVIIISLIAIFGHNLLDGFAPTNPILSAIWSFLHVRAPIPNVGINLIVIYPMIPWIFLMPLGYYFGELYKKDVNPNFRTKKLWQLGLGTTALFFIIRFANFYGDQIVWTYHETFSFTIMSFFDLSKYPPSLLYLLITIGPTLIFLALAEKWEGGLFDKLITIGRVPMFFYVAHIFAIHIGATIAAVLTGYKFSDMVIDFFVIRQPELQGYGFSLPIVYLVWVLIIVVLYPFCSWFNNYKSNNKDKWWLSYL